MVYLVAVTNQSYRLFENRRTLTSDEFLSVYPEKDPTLLASCMFVVVLYIDSRRRTGTQINEILIRCTSYM